MYHYESPKPVSWPVVYDLPSYRYAPGAAAFSKAYKRLLSMITDSASFSLKQAVFSVENAFFGNTIDSAGFQKELTRLTPLVNNQIKLAHHNPQDNLAKNLAIFRLFTDTIELPNKAVHLPFGYDFKDFWGQHDHSKQFVTKLLATNAGQCHSLPLLYLILAEEVGAEAYLVLSPNHSFVTFPLPTGGWQNVELTSDMLTSDVFVLQSGFVKAEALQNKIYMQRLDRAGLLSFFMTDLVKGYRTKYGYDEFAFAVLRKALQLDPHNISALILYRDYHVARLNFISKQLKLTEEDFKPNFLKGAPRIDHTASRLHREIQRMDKKIDQMGFTSMPDVAYWDWLGSLEKEDARQENKNTILKLEKSLDHRP